MCNVLFVTSCWASIPVVTNLLTFTTSRLLHSNKECFIQLNYILMFYFTKSTPSASFYYDFHMHFCRVHFPSVKCKQCIHCSLVLCFCNLSILKFNLARFDHFPPRKITPCAYFNVGNCRFPDPHATTNNGVKNKVHACSLCWYAFSLVIDHMLIECPYVRILHLDGKKDI